MKRLTILLVTLTFLIAGGAAQEQGQNNLDTVLLASTANYPDAMISASPANKLGVPVLLTDKTSLTDSTSTALDNLQPDEVIIVGGPSVVSEKVQNKVEQEANVTRLWGSTQIGTSNEVADYFWAEGSEEATVVQYPQTEENYNLLSAVKSEVEDEEEPILISKEGTLSASTLSKLESLGATEVEVYSTNAVNVTQDLRDIGVEEVEMEEAEIEQLEETIEQRTSQRIRQGETLIVVAAPSFRDSISIPANPNSTTLTVESEEEISEIMEAAESAENVKAVGNPELAETVKERIESETGKNVEVLSGSPEKISTNLTERNLEKWQKIQQQRMPKWAQNVRSSPGLRKAANKSLEKAEKALGENASKEAEKALEDARKAFENGEHFKAKKIASRVASEARANKFQKMSAEEIRESVQEEQEDMREATRELREEAKEAAEELQEAETVEERLEIVKEFRGERRDMGQEHRERNQKQPGNEVPEDTETEVGESEIEAEYEEGTLKVKASYTGRTTGYTTEKNIEVTNDTVEATFNLQSPEGVAGQAVTKYDASVEEELSGNYQLNAKIVVDGETVNTLQKNLKDSGGENKDDEEPEDEATEEEDTNEDTQRGTNLTEP